MSQSDIDDLWIDQRFSIGAKQNVFLDLSTKHDWSVHRVAREVWQHPTHFRRRDSIDYSLGVVLNGEGQFEADGQSMLPLTAGSVFTFGPGGGHGYESIPGAELEIIIIETSGKSIEEILIKCFGAVRGVVHCAPFEEVRQLANLILASALRGSAYHLATCRHLLQSLVYAIAGASFHESMDPGQARIEKAQQYMNEHWRAMHSVEEVADACGVSPAHLSRLFRSHLGMSPQQMLHRLRIRHAAMELIAGASIGELAQRYYYADAFSFSKSFKRVTGLSPKFYLKRYRGEG